MDFAFKICVPFWIDIEDKKSSTRLRNVRFIQEEIRKMVDYLKNNNCPIDFTIYDFSPEPVLTGAIHKPFPLGCFRKSEKWNQILKNVFSDYFIGLDSDMFIHPSDWDKFHGILNGISDPKQIILFNAKCIRDHDIDKVDWIAHDTDNLLTLDMHYYCTPGNTGSFGGLWIAPTRLLKKAGGFNENIKYRGDEDGELYTRVCNENQLVPTKISHLVPIHLPHVYHFGNPNYQNKNEHGGEWKPKMDW